MIIVTGALFTAVEFDGDGTIGDGVTRCGVVITGVVDKEGRVVDRLFVPDEVSFWAALILNGLSVYPAGLGDVVLSAELELAVPDGMMDVFDSLHIDQLI